MRGCRYTTVLLGAVLVVALGAPTATALDVLIADDYFSGHLDFLVTALAGHTVTHLDNTDAGNNPIYTDDATFMAAFDAVIFYGSGNDNTGRAITTAEESALESYIQSGGNLIVTGVDILGDPDDPRLADIVRSSTYGDETGVSSWTGADVHHFILSGPFGDYHGNTISPGQTDHDALTADAARGAISLGSLDGSSFDKIVFTDVVAPGGSVGMWNGNDYGDDWNPSETDGDKGLAMLRNWLAGLTDADEDGAFDADDNCPTTPNVDQEDADGDGVGDVCDDCPATAAGDPVDSDGCSTADDDADGVFNDDDVCPGTPTCATSVGADGCAIDSDGDGNFDGCEPQTCCGATGPVAPLGLAIGMLLLSRFAGCRTTRRRP